MKPHPATAERRLLRALTASALSLTALLLGRRVIPGIAHGIAARLAGRIAPSEGVTWEAANPADEMTPVIAYGLAVVFAVAGVALAIGLQRLASRRPVVARAVAAASALCALVFARAESSTLGIMVALLLVTETVFLVPYAGGGLPRPRATRPLHLVMGAVLAEAFALAWGMWLVGAPRGMGPVVVVPIVLAVAIGGARIGTSMARGEGAASLDAVTFSPLLALPLLGLLRAPSPVWLAVAALAGAIVRVVVTRRRSVDAALSWIALVAVPFALAAVLVVPLGFRGLPDENYLRHEGFHAGWVNSVFHGKLMMADASFIYGPLREYTLAALLRLSGPTLEHLRMAHLALNLTGLALLLAAGRHLARGKMAVQLWLAYLAATATALRSFVQYGLYICFGWADLLRSALPAFALVGLLRAVAAMPHEGRIARAGWARATAWSFLIGCGFLYSQEYGFVAALAGAGAAFVHRGVVVKGTRARITAAAAMAALVGAASAAPFVIQILIYALFGKAGALVRSTFHFGALVAGGKMNAFPVPITADEFIEPWELFRPFVEGQKHDPRYHEANVQFILAAGVVVVAAAALAFQAAFRRWGARSTLMLGLTLFSAATYRITLSRGDSYHILSSTTGPCLLAAMMMADTASLRVRLAAPRWATLRLGAFAAAGIVAFSLLAGESIGAIHARAVDIASGAVAPSPATPYEHPTLPRAGDMNVSAATQHVVEYIQKVTQRTDPIFCRIDMMRGGEIYFLADRRNSTPFDTIHEITTAAMQEEANRALHDSPPEVVIGTDETYIGPAASAYLRENYEPLAPIDGYAVARRRRPK